MFVVFWWRFNVYSYGGKLIIIKFLFKKNVMKVYKFSVFVVKNILGLELFRLNE